MMMPLVLCLTACCVATALYVAVALLLRRRVDRSSVGFLHPASGAGGGGERVLWVAVDHLLRSRPDATVHVFSTRFPPPDAPAPDDDAACTAHLLDVLVPRQFGIAIGAAQRRRLRMRYVPLQWLQDPSCYPVARLLLQSVVGGAALFAGVLYALLCGPSSGAAVPELLIDSVGIPFSYAWLRAWLWGCRVGCYVHYPYISSDMIESVASGRAMPNNPEPARGAKRWLKLRYYEAMVALYRALAGGAVNGPVWCNSSWTRNHIVRLWSTRAPASIRLLFPPVNVDGFKRWPLARTIATVHEAEDAGGGGGAQRRVLRPVLVSVGQFRPEKDHPLLLRAFAAASRGLRPLGIRPQLVIVGGARNDADRERADALRALCTDTLGLTTSTAVYSSANGAAAGAATASSAAADVDFRLNAPFADLEAVMQRAVVGVHTMRDEHFGIVVVEYMAAGCVAIAHRSAGPAEIVRDGVTGYLCDGEAEYAATMARVLTKMCNQCDSGEDAFGAMRVAARAAADRFTDAGFAQQLDDALFPTSVPVDSAKSQ